MKPKNKCYVVTKNPQFFSDIQGFENEGYEFCSLKDMILPNRISFDEETTGLSPLSDEIFAIQLGTGTNNYLIDLQDYSTSIKFKEYEGLTTKLEEVVPYFIDKELVGQNIVFDLGFLNIKNYFPKVVFDTFLASTILLNGSPPNIRHGFADIMKRELNLVYDKTDQKNIATVKLSQLSTIQYSFNDVDRLLEAHDSLYKKLQDYGALPAYLLHCKHIRVVSYIQLCGLPINEYKWREKMQKDEFKSKIKAQEVKDYIWENLPQFRDSQIDLFDTSKRIKVLLSSPTQMLKVFQAFKINTVDSDGKNSINEGIIKKTKHEFVNLWLDYVGATHQVNSFGQNILNQAIGGRLYANFNPILQTARMSTRKGYPNLLTMPNDRDTRSSFTTTKGYKLIVADADNQESIILADKSLDDVMVASVLQGLDLHCAFTRLIYPEVAELSDNEIKEKHNKKRSIAKGGRFCFAYGGGGFTAAQNLDLPLEEGMRLEALYKELHPKVYEYGNKNLVEALKHGYIESVEGFKLILPEFETYTKLDKQIKEFDKDFWAIYREGKEEYKAYWKSFEERKIDKEVELYVVQNKDSYNHYKEHKDLVSKFFQLKSQYFRLSLNNPIQTTGAFHIKRAGIYLFDFIEQNNHYWKAKICNVPHDEYVLEVLEELVDIYVPKVGECMREAGDYYLKSGIVKSGAEGHSGNSWYEAK